MMNQNRSAASWAWSGLVFYVAAYDIWAIKTGRETMSQAMYRALENPQKRVIVAASWALLTKHLFFPSFCPWIDPLKVLAGRIGDE